MMKKSLALLFIGLIIFSVVISSVSAEWDGSTFIGKFMNEWAGNEGIDAATIKYLLLFLITGFIFSALGFMNMPENNGIRFAIALIAGFLTTSTLSAPQIVAAMESYTALGIAITLFLPILVLGAISFQVIIKGQFIGVVIQRILWLVYSLYLFLKSAGDYLWTSFLADLFVGVKSDLISKVGSVLGTWFTNETGKGSGIILFIQAVVAIALFWIMFVKNQAVRKYLRDEKFNDQVEKVKNSLKKSRELRKAESESFDSA